MDQFLCMAFAQLSYRDSLRDTVCCLRSMQHKLYHMGICGNVSRSTLADANEKRDWRIYADFAQILIQRARELYVDDAFGAELNETVYALDSSTIDLCLAVFPWAKFRQHKSAVKLHTLLDLRGNIPTFISITDGKYHDVNILDVLVPEPGSFYVMDRGYLDFSRLHVMKECSSYFVIRSKSNTRFRRVYSNPVDKATGILCDQAILLTGQKGSTAYPDQLRRVKYYDAEKDRRFNFLTNNFIVPAITIADLYRCRWQVELFFKWIKQHLRIKSFYGTSENAVKTQLWIAVSVYVLVAILKKRLYLKQKSLYTILQILSVSLFEKAPILQVLTDSDYTVDISHESNQLELFAF
jgi:transposase